MSALGQQQALRCVRPSPLYPSKQTFGGALGMSVQGQNRTHAVQQKSLFNRVGGGTKKLLGTVYFRPSRLITICTGPRLAIFRWETRWPLDNAEYYFQVHSGQCSPTLLHLINYASAA